MIFSTLATVLCLAQLHLALLELGAARLRLRSSASAAAAREERSAPPARFRAESIASDGAPLQRVFAESAAPAPRATRAAAERAALPDAALVVLSHDRADYLRTTLGAALALEDVSLVRVYVSLDAPARFAAMEAVVAAVGRAARRAVTVWRHPPSLRRPPVRGKRPRGLELIAAHFYAVLERALLGSNHSHAILLEDDLLPAPDFLTLFRAAAPLLEADGSLWCVSAWNDNGMGRARPPAAELARTDFFPGLGWMVRAGEWRRALREPWAAASAAGAGPMSTGWDYWLRFSGLLAGRGCVFPLTPRTRHIGRRGTNVNAKEATFLDAFALSAARAAPIDALAAARFAAAGVRGRLDGLRKGPYEAFLARLLAGEVDVDGETSALAPPAPAPIVSAAEASAAGWAPPAPLVAIAASLEEYRALSARLALWPAHARGAHAGIVRTRHANATLLLVDRRAGARWLPAPLRLERRADARTVAARTAGASCDATCALEGLRCDPAQLQFANSCAELRAHFACERGCGHQVGEEIPCYVSDRERDTAGVCLHSDIVSTCAAAFRATTRLCVCVPS